MPCSCELRVKSALKRFILGADKKGKSHRRRIYFDNNHANVWITGEKESGPTLWLFRINQLNKKHLYEPENQSFIGRQSRSQTDNTELLNIWHHIHPVTQTTLATSFSTTLTHKHFSVPDSFLLSLFHIPVCRLFCKCYGTQHVTGETTVFVFNSLS